MLARTSSLSGSATAWLTLGALTVFALVAFLSWFLSARQRTLRRLRSVRPTAIASLTEGATARVDGRVRLGGDSHVAPLSGRRCAYYEVQVDQRVSSGKSHHWRKLVREEESCDFFVRDETGEARVDMSLARVVSAVDVTRRSGTWNDASPELEAFLAERGVASKGWVFNKTLRYREAVVEEGEQVGVLGQVGSEVAPEAGPGDGYRDPARRRVLGAPPGGQLIVTDIPS